MVNAGDVLTYVAQANSTFFGSPNQDVTAVGSILTGAGITVENVSINSSALSVVESADTTIAYQVTLQVQVASAYNSPQDVESIIDNAFYQVEGSLPLSSSIVDVNGASTGAATSSGNTAYSSNLGSAVGGTIGSGISSLFSGLGVGGTVLSFGLVLLVVILVLVFLMPEQAAHVGSVFS